jgi:hypothetical protein
MPLTITVTSGELELEVWSFETPPRVFVWDAMAPRLSFHGMRDATSTTFDMGHLLE